MKLRLCRKLILLFLVLIFAAASLCGCKFNISRGRAEADLDRFLTCIENGDYAEADALLHPDCEINTEEYITGVEASAGIEFSSGIEIVKYTGFVSALYDSDVGGSIWGRDFKIEVDGKYFLVYVDFVRNASGYGIYRFSIE